MTCLYLLNLPEDLLLLIFEAVVRDAMLHPKGVRVVNCRLVSRKLAALSSTCASLTHTDAFDDLLRETFLITRALETDKWSRSMVPPVLVQHLQRKVASDRRPNRLVLTIRETLSSLEQAIPDGLSELEGDRVTLGICEMAVFRKKWEAIKERPPSRYPERMSQELHTNVIIAAVYLGRLDVIIALLVKGADVDVDTEFFGRPVSVAASLGNDEVIRLLQTIGSSLTFTPNLPHLKKISYRSLPTRPFIPLHFAASNGHLSTVKLLVNSLLEYSDGDLAKRELFTSLLCAAGNGHYDVLWYLFDYGKFDSEERLECLNLVMIHASRYGKIAVVRSALDAGANVNHRTGLGCATFFATAKGQGSVLRLLLDRKAHSCVLGGGYKGCHLPHPLFVSAKHGHLHTLCMLLDYSGLGINHAMCRSAFLGASTFGHCHVLEEMIHRGITVMDSNLETTQPTLGEKALRMAAAGGHESVVDILIDCGVRRLGGSMKAAEREGQHKMMRYLHNKIESGDILISFFQNQNH